MKTKIDTLCYEISEALAEKLLEIDVPTMEDHHAMNYADEFVAESVRPILEEIESDLTDLLS